MSRTLLVALAHPDDEVGCSGTIAAQVAAGDRVIMLFLTAGEMTESLGPIPTAEVAKRRTKHAHDAGDILGCAEVRVLDFPDTRVAMNPDSNYRIAREIADIKPDAVITWGDAWDRGMRHPDHQATGQIVRNAVTIARITKAVAPTEPHRKVAAVYTMRDSHSVLPIAAIDVARQRKKIHELAAFYRQFVNWPDPVWLDKRLDDAGKKHGVEAAELFDSWDGAAGVRTTLL